MKYLLTAALCAAFTVPALAQDSFGQAQQQQALPQPAPPPPQQQPQQQRPQDQQGPQSPQMRPNPNTPQMPRQQGNGGNPKLDQLMTVERQDFGVPATRELHNGAMHGNTPASLPGGQLITTKGLVALVQGKQAPYVLLDVLGGPESLPGAVMAAWASQPGSFNDNVQQQFAQMLQQVTQRNKEMPLVLYCASPQCWMSYNASLRAINLGYTNVLWYRGGIETWKSAGLQTMSKGGNGF